MEDGEAIGVQAADEILLIDFLALFFLLHLAHQERLIESGLERHALRRADPVERSLDPAVCAFASAEGVHVHRAMQLGDVALRVLDALLALDDIRALKPHFIAGEQAEELLGGTSMKSSCSTYTSRPKITFRVPISG